MTGNYQDFTRKVWKEPPENYTMAELPILALGIVGEAGEIAEKVKKDLHYGRAVDPSDMVKELGDVVYYVARLAEWYGFTLDDVINTNVAKLSSRLERGVLHGVGDNR